MAQWMGQYSGKTHLTRIQDREKQLRHAVEMYNSKETKGEQDAYVSSLIQFAEKLLNARVKALRAQIASLDPRNEEAQSSIESKIERLSETGFVAILREFGVDSIPSSNTQ